MVPAYTSKTTFVFKPRHPPQSGVVVVRSDAHNHFETLSDLQAFVAYCNRGEQALARGVPVPVGSFKSKMIAAELALCTMQ